MKKIITLLLVMLFSIGVVAKISRFDRYQKFWKACTKEIKKNKKYSAVDQRIALEGIRNGIVGAIQLEKQGLGGMADETETYVIKAGADKFCKKASGKYLK